MKSARETVIFLDAGGTLIEPVRPVGHVYAEVARAFGVQADGDRLHQGFIRAWKTLKPRDPVRGARVMDDRMWWQEIVRESWSGMTLPTDFEAYFDRVYTDFARPDHWREFPEVGAVLEAARQAGFRCAVLSNWDRRLHTVLEGFAWSRHFEQILISSEIGAEKPHPLIFREAERRLGIGPESAVLWGDDADCDGEGARNAGWCVGLVDRPARGLERLLEQLSVSIGP